MKKRAFGGHIDPPIKLKPTTNSKQEMDSRAVQKPIKHIQEVQTTGYKSNGDLPPGTYQKVYYTDPRDAKIENQDFEYIDSSGYKALQRMRNYQLYSQNLNKPQLIHPEMIQQPSIAGTTFAMGGQLNGNKNTMLNEFNEGGSHESNPLGGIPQGNGNTVEQGETRKGDFIFSDRIILTPDVIEQFSLPKSLANKTAAEASKIMNNKFEGRNDRISDSTKKNLLDKVSQAQETIKAKQEALAQAMQANSTQVPDMMNGQVPQGFEQPMRDPMQEGSKPYFWGGLIGGASNALAGNALGSAASGAMGQMGNSMSGMADSAMTGSMTQAAGNGSSMLSMAGNTGQAMSGNNNLSKTPMTDKETKLQNLSEGAKDMVAKVIPIAGVFRGVEKFGKGLGQAIGGDEGGDLASGFLDPMQNVFREDTNVGEKTLSLMDPIVSGLIMQKKNKERRAEAKRQGYLEHMKDRQHHFADGGYLNDPNDPYGDLINKYPNRNPKLGQTGLVPLSENDLIERNGYSNPEVAPLTSTTNMGVNPNSNPQVLPKIDFSKIGDTVGQAARYAPVAANALQLAKLKKPAYQRLNRLDQRFRPEYVDERAGQNIVNNEMNNTIGALTQMGGSEGAMRNSIIAASLNKTKALSDIQMKAADMNRNTNAQAQQFNAGINQTNLNQSNTEMDINDRNQANYRNQKSKLIAAIGTDIGEIGKEQTYKKLAKETFGYTWDGKYYVKPDGTKITKDEFEEEVKTITGKKPKENRLGGYLNKKLK